MSVREAFAQGCRCGHIDGRARTGYYVTGEDIELSWEVVEVAA